MKVKYFQRKCTNTALGDAHFSLRDEQSENVHSVTVEMLMSAAVYEDKMSLHANKSCSAVPIDYTYAYTISHSLFESCARKRFRSSVES